MNTFYVNFTHVFCTFTSIALLNFLCISIHITTTIKKITRGNFFLLNLHKQQNVYGNFDELKIEARKYEQKKNCFVHILPALNLCLSIQYHSYGICLPYPHCFMKCKCYYFAPTLFIQFLIYINPPPPEKTEKCWGNFSHYEKDCGEMEYLMRKKEAFGG